MLVSDYQLARARLGMGNIYESGFGSFGTASGWQPNKDCPATGSWEAYCDCVYPEGDQRNRCRSKPLGFLTPAPWTIAGKTARGVGDIAPAIVQSVVNAGQSYIASVAPPVQPVNPPVVASTSPVSPVSPSSGSAFPSFIPTSLTSGGGAGLGLAALAGFGVLALILLKKK